MSFLSTRDLVESFNNGKTITSSFRKVPSQASTTNVWVDLSMASGSPIPNYYASTPVAAAKLDPLKGLFHGVSQSPNSKYLANFSVTTPTAALVGHYTLLDYLLYYPFFDLDSLDEQVMDNATTLDRYETGDGVQVMAVAASPTVGSGRFSFTYLNQNGELKTSPTQFCATSSLSIASLITSQPATVAGLGPYLKLASGDTGVRQIVTATNTVANGGLAALVLVKPLLDFQLFEINTVTEQQLLTHKQVLPRVYEGAFLNLIMCPAGSVSAGTLTGLATFVWE